MNPDQDDFDPREGMAEDVIAKPLRKPKTALTLSEVLAPLGQTKGLPTTSPEAQNHDYITLRGPLGITQLAISHYPIFRTLWALWSKRRGGAEEASATAYEVAEALGEGVQRVRHVLTALAKTGVVRQMVKSTAYRGVRVRYLPTRLGEQLFAIAEEFGYGVQIQIGKTVRAWRSANQTEPLGIFERAKLYLGNST
jgi:hypothetical protein